MFVCLLLLKNLLDLVGMKKKTIKKHPVTPFIFFCTPQLHLLSFPVKSSNEILQDSEQDFIVVIVVVVVENTPVLTGCKTFSTSSVLQFLQFHYNSSFINYTIITFITIHYIEVKSFIFLFS